MLEPLFESTAKERILFFLHTHGESFPREIARDLGIYVNTVRNQLLKLERGGVLYSRLKGKVRYQPIGFELLPPKFTLSELQHLYEAVLETGLDKRNFLRRIDEGLAVSPSISDSVLKPQPSTTRRTRVIVSFRCLGVLFAIDRSNASREASRSCSRSGKPGSAFCSLYFWPLPR